MQQRKTQENAEERKKQFAKKPEDFLWQFGFKQSFHAQGYALLYAHGESMEPRFLAGDLVFVQLGVEVQSGEYAAVSIDGGRAELFRILRQKKGILLCPENRAFPMRFFPANEMQRLRIFDKVVKSMRSL